MKKLLLLFTVLLSTVGASAFDFCYKGIYYSILGTDWVAVTNNGKKNFFGEPDGSSYSGQIEIPSSAFYNGKEYRVKAIEDAAFANCTGLTSVEIPHYDQHYNFTSIGSYAFYGCTGLTSVDIPRHAKTIGEYAFYGCSSLRSVWIPSEVSTIGSYAFANCTTLASVILTGNDTEIGDLVFCGCTRLREIYSEYASEDNRCLIVDGVLKAFAPSGLTSYSIPNSVTEIGIGAFAFCSGLIHVIIPETVTTIGIEAFYGCTGLTAITGKFASDDHRCLIVDDKLVSFAPSGLTSYSIPNSVNIIGDFAFEGCSKLTSVDIPSNISTIGNGAFAGCSGLTSVEIPTLITEISDYAFYNCSGLTSVVIPNSVTSIGSDAFEYLYLTSPQQPELSESNHLYFTEYQYILRF